MSWYATIADIKSSCLITARNARARNFVRWGSGLRWWRKRLLLSSLPPRSSVWIFDTARTRAAYERIIADFEKGKTQILIGTQMLSKGLDFGNVSVVGILNADSLMNFPDFRAHERAFQLMVQVSGRAGRRDKRGTVVLQTFSLTIR